MNKTATSRKLLLVEWVDSHSGKGWQPLDTLAAETGPVYCRSVGWLVSDDNGTLVLVPHISGERNGNIRLFGAGDLAIPHKAIIRRKTLRA